MIRLSTLLLILTFSLNSQAQDTLKQKWFNAHFQLTCIGQYHPKFNAKYTGTNSMLTGSEMKISVTSTIYLGVRLWKGAQFYVNPELAGGYGFSSTLGAAGFPNGETFRVGSPAPAVYIARAYLRQYVAISKKKVYQQNDANQLQGYIPERYFSIVAGRFCVADFFDANSFAHDARTQFMNWSLMSNAAWDYPANTRGYTYGIVLEAVLQNFAIRGGLTVIPKAANGSIMNFDIRKAGGSFVEGEYGWNIKGQPGKIRAMAFLNYGNMGNYNIAAAMDTPDVTSTQNYSRIKYGFGINAEQNITENVGVFLKGSWNDGKTETWMFTEIDHSVSAGVSVTGSYWKRKNDVVALAFVMNGISNEHKNYLTKGGYGFIIGDGQLNYAPEFVAEFYYSFELWKNRIFVSPDYQFILNPAYNKDRGPVHALGLRAHVEF